MSFKLSYGKVLKDMIRMLRVAYATVAKLVLIVMKPNARAYGKPARVYGKPLLNLPNTNR